MIHPWMPSKSLDENDIEWRPPFWEIYLKEIWGIDSKGAPISPIIIKICLYPADSQKKRVIPSFREAELRIIYETRPPAALYANPRRMYRPVLGGVSVGVGKQVFGTLGGILTNSSNLHFGLTCSHVISGNTLIDQPAFRDGRKSAPIGKVIYATALHPCTAKDPCNPWVTNVPINEVDAALIEIYKNIASNLEILQIGKLTGITPRAQLTQGQTAEFTGRSSGHNVLELGGMAVSYRMILNGTIYCFLNLIELKQPSYWGNVFSEPVKEGDSGAWICIPSNRGYEWCGMVIGGDRFIGYVISSQTIANWWSNRKNLVLSVA